MNLQVGHDPNHNSPTSREGLPNPQTPILNHPLTDNLAALRRVAIIIFCCLINKPNKPKKAKDLKLQ